MKEATGELSTTVIAVVAIAAVATIFTTLVLPGLRSTINQKVHCGGAYACGACTSGIAACKYDDETSTGIAINCPCS